MKNACLMDEEDPCSVCPLQKIHTKLFNDLRQMYVNINVYSYTHVYIPNPIF